MISLGSSWFKTFFEKAKHCSVLWSTQNVILANKRAQGISCAMHILVIVLAVSVLAHCEGVMWAKLGPVLGKNL